jgi:hypothetical protein
MATDPIREHIARRSHTQRRVRDYASAAWRSHRCNAVGIRRRVLEPIGSFRHEPVGEWEHIRLSQNPVGFAATRAVARSCALGT